MDASILLEGQAPFPARDWMKNPTVNQMSVTEGYFEATGARLLAGRLFTARDTAGSSPVVIIGETAARRLFPGLEPIGRQLSVAGAPKDAEGNSRWQTVVGVVSDSRLRGIDDVRLDVYMPHQQATQRVNAIVVRTTAEPAALAPAVRAAILAVDPRAVIGRVAYAGCDRRHGDGAVALRHAVVHRAGGRGVHAGADRPVRGDRLLGRTAPP